MKIIGLTGGIGSGKSTVLSFFKEFDIPVYISDIEAKKIMNVSEEVINKIIFLFGKEAYVGGVLDRKYIAEIVFADIVKLKELNAIVHPVVHKDFIQFVKKQNTPYLIYESALLFENKTERQFDKVILVTAPLELRIQRLLKRDQSSLSDIKARIKNQLTDKDKIKKADFVLVNTEMSATKEEVHRLHKIFLE
ncbi:dephospho-CoA kinase [Flavicella sp.]|uniref:dephospho-CoA kinase n=1 Tax=Flavicella sp. TaxID=2957742 RepID=UPI0030189820